MWPAEIDGALAAHSYVHAVSRVPRQWPHRERWAHLTRVFTRPAFRDRGVGSRLLRAVVDWARQTELHLLLVWPSERSVSL